MQLDITTRYTVTVIDNAPMVSIAQGIIDHLEKPERITFIRQANGNTCIRAASWGDLYTYSLHNGRCMARRAVDDQLLQPGTWLVRLLPDQAVEIVCESSVLDLPHSDPTTERSWLTSTEVKHKLGLSDTRLREYVENDLIRATPIDQIPNPPKRIHGHNKVLFGKKEIDRFIQIRRAEHGPVI